jgi:hypothetical protein
MGVEVNYFESGKVKVSINSSYHRIEPLNMLGVKDAVRWIKSVKKQGVAEGAPDHPAPPKAKISLTAAVDIELSRHGCKKGDPTYEKEFSATAANFLKYAPGRYVDDVGAKATSLSIDFLKNLLNILQQKYPNTEFNLESDRVESNDGELTVIADTAEEGRYVGCFMWDVSTGPYKGALELAIKQTTDQLLQANPGKKPALFIGGDNQNPEAWEYIAKKLKYKLITEDDDMFEQSVTEGIADSPEEYKAHLIKTIPAIMQILAKTGRGWSPSEEEMLAAVDTGYMVMKHTGDVKQAGKAMMDELNTLHKMSQGQQGVTDQVNEYTVRNTKKFIQRAHDTEQGQKYGSLPYSSHPKSVANIGKKFFGTKFTPDAVKVALLHDVLEDTPYTPQQLAKKGFSKEIIDAVQLLTKNKNLSYADNIKNIINSGNKLAMMVKYSDNYMNFTGDKSHWDPDRAAHSKKKYLASLNALGDVLGITKHIGDTKVTENADYLEEK